MLNETLCLMTVYYTIQVVKTGDVPRMRRWLCSWCALTVAMLLEDLLVRGLLSKMMLMVMFMASDALAAELLIDTVVLPKWNAVEEFMNKWTEVITNEVKIRSFYWLTKVIAWYKRHSYEKSVVSIEKEY